MEVTEWQRAATKSGMVHFATEENRDARRYCGGCAHGEQVHGAVKGDMRNRARCRKMARALKERGSKGKPEIIEAGTPGCKHWEARDEHPR